eukprot:754824-Hanusia_phi.AAC.3
MEMLLRHVQAEDLCKCVNSIVQQFCSTSDGEKKCRSSKSRSLYNIQVKEERRRGGEEERRSLRDWYEDKGGEKTDMKFVVNLVDIDCYADEVRKEEIGEGGEVV